MERYEEKEGTMKVVRMKELVTGDVGRNERCRWGE